MKKCINCQKDTKKYHTDYNGQPICPQCVDHHYEKCSDCGQLVHIQESSWTSIMFTYCPHCVKNYVYCSECGDLVHKDSVHKVGDDFLCKECKVKYKNGKTIYKYSYKPNPVFFGESDYHFGVEIEIYSSDNRQKVLEVFEEWNNHSIYIKEDNSLSSSGFEIVSHPHSFQALKEAKWLKAIECLKDSCTAFDKAGMHIHISRSAFDSNDHYDRFWRIWNEYPELVKWVAQREYGKYTKVEPAGDNKIKINSPRKHNRHCVINENNVHTIEIRAFNSSLKYSILMKNIEFTHAVIEYTRQVTAVSIAGLWSFIKKHKKMYSNLVKFRNKNRKGWEKII